MVNNFFRKYFYLFIFLAPFTSAFALNGWIRLPDVIILSFILLYSLVYFPYSGKEINIQKEDLLVVAFLLLSFLSLCFNYSESKNLTNFLALVFVIGVYFFAAKLVIQKLGIDSEQIGKIVYYSAITCCVIMLIDWVIVNFFDIEIRPYFINLTNGTANMFYFTKNGYKTVAGVAEEPGSMAFLLNTYGLIGLDYCKQHRQKKEFNLFLILYLLALLSSFSTGGIACLIIAAILFNFRRIFIGGGAIMPILVFFIIVVLSGNVLAIIYNEFYIKAFSSEESVSALARFFSWRQGISDWLESPLFGKGPGYGSLTLVDGYLSFFLKVLAETGTLSFLVIFMFMIVIFKKAKNVSSILKIALVAGILHLFIISDFYHAPFWILIFLIQLRFKELKVKNIIA